MDHARSAAPARKFLAFFWGSFLLCASSLEWALAQLLFAAAAGEQSNRGSSPSWAKLIVLEGGLAFLETC